MEIDLYLNWCRQTESSKVKMWQSHVLALTLPWIYDIDGSFIDKTECRTEECHIYTLKVLCADNGQIWKMVKTIFVHPNSYSMGWTMLPLQQHISSQGLE